MNDIPAISICIPAYKNKAYLIRLLDSIKIQEFKNFEVVVSDDSPDSELETCLESYKTHFRIIYFKNHIPLGSPANWNKSIHLAKGKWIKIMHDDDWFVNEKALGVFYEATQESNDEDFIFSGFINHNLNTGTNSPFVIRFFDEWMLKTQPLYLFRTNYIGHPSTTLIRNNRSDWFDVNVKWVVDIAFYMKVLSEGKKCKVIDEPLVFIGVGLDQITKQAFRNPAIEIPENLYLLNKLGAGCLANIFVYDYYWRLIRNLRIAGVEDVKKYESNAAIPKSLVQMIQVQQKLNQAWLVKSGIYSKLTMSICYILERIRRDY